MNPSISPFLASPIGVPSPPLPSSSLSSSPSSPFPLSPSSSQPSPSDLIQQSPSATSSLSPSTSPSPSTIRDFREFFGSSTIFSSTSSLSLSLVLFDPFCLALFSSFLFLLSGFA